ncbi:ABC transporter ATP-binding protein [soil metagenome]
MTPLLEIKNLTTVFETDESLSRAVDNISFTVNKGETVGIVGESGSGKSVTALSIMRLISPPGKISTGEIIFHENGTAANLLSLNDAEIRKYRGNKMAMVFQEPSTSLNPLFTCGEQVAEALIVHGKASRSKARAQSISLFSKVQLTNPEQIYNSYPHQLSGGQKQRVMIAMAISCTPSLLIADEPTTALDVTIQKAILELLRQLQQENGMGMLFISHDLGVIAEIADRVVVLYKGKIVEEGGVKEIFTNPKHPYTKGLLACRPPLDKKLRVLPTIADFMRVNKDGSFVEHPGSVDESVSARIISREEIFARNRKLYDQQPILQVKNLKTYFPLRKGLFGNTKGYIKAVDDVSFDVFPGETLGLVGESGCGKTTLGRTIIKLTKSTSGQVLFKDIDLAELSGNRLRKMRRHIQFIFQDPYLSLNPRMKIGDAITEPMYAHKIYATREERKEKTLELLKRVGLTENHFNQFPHQLSVGQRQRVCIARSIGLQPEFIICDEPVSALDVSIQAQVLNLLNELKQDYNFTCIFISHDLSVVKFMSDRMIVMNQGKIEEMGLAGEVYINPKSAYTRKLIEAIPKGR